MNHFRQSDMTRLASEVLSEIPHQVLSFTKAKGVSPMMRRFGGSPAARKAKADTAGKYEAGGNGT